VVTLDVRDDGTGFTPPVPGHAGAASLANGTAKANGISHVNGTGHVNGHVNGTGRAQEAGTEDAASMSGGFGLIAMRQRVSRLAGQLEIESEPGAGTAVSASLPAIPLGGTS
jgi:signal transduction histidine kinase